MLLKKIAVIFVFLACFIICSIQASASDEFSIRPYSANDFYTFVKVFSEMRGPLREEILKDKKTNFENADPLKYVEKVKDKRDVKATLKKAGLTWGQFTELFGNILMGYFSAESQSTKAALIRQLADYGLLMNVDEIPEEYRGLVTEVVKTDAGSSLAAIALEQIIEIPEQNVKIARENKSQLDRMFYTKYWIGELR